MNMNKTDRPFILPTALSSGTMLWSLVFGLYFLAALLGYFAWCRLAAAEARLAEKTPTHVESQYFHCTLPKSVDAYSIQDDVLVMYLDGTNRLPVLTVSAFRDPGIAYRAIDANPALCALNIKWGLRSFGIEEYVESSCGPIVLGTDFSRIKPGVLAARAYFDLGTNEGLAYFTAIGDTCYFVFALWEDGRRLDVESLREELLKFFDGIEFIASPDRFARPHVNSAELTAEEHEKILFEARREEMLWRMFAERIGTEPETALVAAIEHFRKFLELRSSVREEREVVESEDFKRYERLLEQRARVVREWFVLLDKHLATGDLEAAHRQSDFIQRHATLVEESLDRARAAGISAKLAAQEAEQQKGK